MLKKILTHRNFVRKSLRKNSIITLLKKSKYAKLKTKNETQLKTRTTFEHHKPLLAICSTPKKKS